MAVHKPAVTARAEIRFHVIPREINRWRNGERLVLFSRLADLCDKLGIPYRAVERPREQMDPTQGPADGHLHIVENGRMQGEGWLNAATAYLQGFWHLDPVGVLAESSAADADPDLSQVDPGEAQSFFLSLRDALVLPRRSRFKQPEAVAQDLPQGCVAVFLQGRAAFQAGRCHVKMDRLIEAVAKGAGGRPVLVKPHPRAVEFGREAIARAQLRGAEVQVTDANVHDVLATAVVTVSANSAAAMEGFLHRKPAILFGRSDFSGLSVRARDEADFPRALGLALAEDWPYPEMLYWYFSSHTVELDAPDFEARVWRAFARVGFPPERLVPDWSARGRGLIA